MTAAFQIAPQAPLRGQVLTHCARCGQGWDSCSAPALERELLSLGWSFVVPISAIGDGRPRRRWHCAPCMLAWHRFVRELNRFAAELGSSRRVARGLPPYRPNLDELDPRQLACLIEQERTAVVA